MTIIAERKPKGQEKATWYAPPLNQFTSLKYPIKNEGTFRGKK